MSQWRFSYAGYSAEQHESLSLYPAIEAKREGRGVVVQKELKETELL